jgi:hypothetical protein
MTIKVNHFAAKTVTLLTQLKLETFVIELSVAIILTVMAMGGYRSGLWLLWIPCGVTAAACYFVVIFSVYQFTSEKLANKSVGNSDT